MDNGNLNGWLLDLYPCPQGMTLWLLTPSQTAHRLIDPSFHPCFYVDGEDTRLGRLASLLPRHFRVACRRVERRNIWDGRSRSVLEVRVHHPTQYSAAVRFASRCDREVQLYDSDLILAALYCWQREVFPLARVEAQADPQGSLLALECKDDPWTLDYELPPLRVMQLRLEGLSRVNPAHRGRAALEVHADAESYVLDDYDVPAAESFAGLLKRYDPDVILTDWGDSAILPILLRQARQCGTSLPLNREPLPVRHSRSRSYMSYGRILFKDSTSTLAGRLHVDARNSFISDKCELDGLWELARVTKLPVQYCARTTTGTGISYMQMELAWRNGVLIPQQKAEPEEPKAFDELLVADRGGLIFLPRLGIFHNVAELDFASEYPSIMARFNISPETVNCPCCADGPRVPELGYWICRKRRGITSRVVERLIVKREQLKQRQRDVPPPARARRYKLQRDALKWLLVCCFGYTGYRNARFGKIEAHEAINAVARETLLVAKETAEQQRFDVLHALVDSLYVRRDGATREDYDRLSGEIAQRTGLPIAVEAVYRTVVFLPSRQHPEIPVPNRFFAVAESGEVKVRGLECRRHDTPPLVEAMQREVLSVLAAARDRESYETRLGEARKILERYLNRLEEGQVSAEELVISKRLTQPVRQYRKPSHPAIAAGQLAGLGIELRPGETVEYILTDAGNKVPNLRVRAYGLLDGALVYDRKKYRELLLDAFAPFAHFNLE